MTFSEQIVYGWFKPSKYKDMIELPRRRFAAYVIVMMLVLAIVSYVVPTASISPALEDLRSFSHRVWVR